MSISFKVTTKSNTKVWEQIKKRMFRDTKSVDVGFFQEAVYPNGTPVAFVAFLNEFGHVNRGRYGGTTPPRPFLRLMFKAYSDKAVSSAHMIPLIQQVALGKMTWTAFYKEIGDNLVELVKERIVAMKAPPNTPLTISLKGFNDPLIDTKLMLNSVRYRISNSKKRE